MATKKFLVEVPDTAYWQRFWRDGAPAIECGPCEVNADLIRKQLLAGAAFSGEGAGAEPQEGNQTLEFITFNCQHDVKVREIAGVDLIAQD